MTPSKAAKLIGISAQQVRNACRAGTIPSTKKPLDNGDPEAFMYWIELKDALYYKRNRPSKGPKPKELVHENLGEAC
jgi:hypothetical protein